MEGDGRCGLITPQTPMSAAVCSVDYLVVTDSDKRAQTGRRRSDRDNKAQKRVPNQEGEMRNQISRRSPCVAISCRKPQVLSIVIHEIRVSMGDYADDKNNQTSKDVTRGRLQSLSLALSCQFHSVTANEASQAERILAGTK